MTGTIIIAGAGLCGARAAFSLRERGYEGQVVLIGSERHAPYDRPPLSKHADDGSLSIQYVAEEASYSAVGIEHVGGVAITDIDPTRHSVTLGDGRSLTYDKLLLAMGARPRLLPGLESLTKVVTLRSFDDALKIRDVIGPGRKLAIIGGGFIGLELAATARKLQTSVTIVESMPRLLARAVPAQVASVIQERHQLEGVEVLLQAGIASITEDASGVHLHLADGRDIAADLVVVGIGAIPNIEIAQAAGLAIDNGIAVDHFMRTSDIDIYAAGDCCSFPLQAYDGSRVRLESWRCAQDQGIIAAVNMLGIATPYEGVPWFWSDQYDLTLQIAGLPGLAVETVRRELSDGSFLLFHLDRDGRLVAASGIGRGNAIGRDIRLCEMLIAAKTHPKREELVSPSTRLKSLLAA
ncbi:MULTISPECIES: NAD(P)/FAD-dependent oxidoreductase [unclassified Rhizobium]|uniref:NAD(P)/FAD-dependent oxidoreductase n=1 Tax=unclassified Rhizobium TaxID=2613769 RepID=UPI001ADC042F|nr:MULTISPECIES: FAD-dependent oxidoreductase [unclassified Rhizobium]MBO9126629.1 FAD-dependent oxidoreductase [Rhizobium sp. 16-488-2b]MBO9177076.1 FAD-dependent oxidoreductase [Rhizobium sp. 16-488-2a]